MNGRFHPEQDDTYVRDKMLSLGYNCTDYKLPLSVRKLGQIQNYKYYIEKGVSFYRLGWELTQVLSKILFNPKDWLAVLGYFLSLIWRVEKFNTAGFV